MDLIIIILTTVVVPYVIWSYAKITTLTKELADYKFKYDALFNTKAAGFISWAKDDEDRYTAVSDKFMTIIAMPIGLKHKDIIGKTDDEIDEFDIEVKNMLNNLAKTVRAKGAGYIQSLKFHDACPPLLVIKQSIAENNQVEFFAFAIAI